MTSRSDTATLKQTTGKPDRILRKRTGGAVNYPLDIVLMDGKMKLFVLEDRDSFGVFP